jgi:hypothetical protein
VTEVISLSRVRKARARAEKDATAAANRVKFGRTKAEKAADEKRKDLAAKQIDGHKRES